LNWRKRVENRSSQPVPLLKSKKIGPEAKKIYLTMIKIILNLAPQSTHLQPGRISQSRSKLGFLLLCHLSRRTSVKAFFKSPAQTFAEQITQSIDLSKLLTISKYLL
jgi:hypothetical protein